MEVGVLGGAYFARSATGESCVVFVSAGPTLDMTSGQCRWCCFRILNFVSDFGP